GLATRRGSSDWASVFSTRPTSRQPCGFFRPRCTRRLPTMPKRSPELSGVAALHRMKVKSRAMYAATLMAGAQALVTAWIKIVMAAPGSGLDAIGHQIYVDEPASRCGRSLLSERSKHSG